LNGLQPEISSCNSHPSRFEERPAACIERWGRLSPGPLSVFGLVLPSRADRADRPSDYRQCLETHGRFADRCSARRTAGRRSPIPTFPRNPACHLRSGARARTDRAWHPRCAALRESDDPATARAKAARWLLKSALPQPFANTIVFGLKKYASRKRTWDLQVQIFTTKSTRYSITFRTRRL